METLPPDSKKPETKPTNGCAEKPTNPLSHVSRVTGSFLNEEDCFANVEDDGGMTKIYAIPTL